MQDHNDSWKTLDPLEDLMASNAIPQNPVIISACLALAKNVTSEWLSKVLVSRILQHPRFSSRIIKRKGHFIFEPIKGFTSSSPYVIKDHITVEDEIDSSLPHHERQKLFTSRIAKILSTDLPEDRPRWKLHVFPHWSVLEEDHQSPDSCCTIIARVHHSIADGIGLVKYFLAQIVDKSTDDDSSGVLKLPTTHRRDFGNKRKRFKMNSKKVSDENGNPVKRMRNSNNKSPGFFRLVSETLGDIYRGSLGMLVPDKRCVFTRTPVQREKACAMRSPKEFTVAAVKDAAKRLGVSINDLLYTAMSGASHQYLEEREEDMKSLSSIRCAVPFNAHMQDAYQFSDVSNQISLIALPMHLNTKDPYQRLKTCSKTLTRAKRGVQLTTSAILLKILVRLPSFAKYRLWNHITKCSSFLFTNVPGPQERVQIDGIDITSIQFFAPADGSAGVILCAFSYDGNIMLSLSGDSQRIADPERFLELMSKEIHTLMDLSKQYEKVV